MQTGRVNAGAAEGQSRRPVEALEVQ